MGWERASDVVTFAAAIGSGIIGGVFYAFSTFVMKALGRLPTNAGVAAMQSINIAVINPKFLGVFVGTAVISALAAILHFGRPGSGWAIAGAALYVLGTFVVTMVFNVPLNNGLAGIEPGDPGAVRMWDDYQRRWTFCNHVRALAAIAALAFFMLALRH